MLATSETLDDLQRTLASTRGGIAAATWAVARLAL